MRTFIGNYIIAETVKKRRHRQDISINSCYAGACITLLNRLYKVYEMYGYFSYIDKLKKIVDENYEVGIRSVYRELLKVYNELTKVVEPS